MPDDRSHRKPRSRARLVSRAAAAAPVLAIATALGATAPGDANAASRSRVPHQDLLDRVIALRQAMAGERAKTADPSSAGEPAPGPKLAQWNKWKNA